MKVSILRIFIISFFIDTFILSSVSAQIDSNEELMHITLLGTGSPVPSTNRAGPATLVQAGNKTLLFDAGRYAMVRLWQAGVPARDINAVFLTHYHHDHINGLADLWLTGWIGADYGLRSRPMRLIGPEGAKNLADGLEQAYSLNNEIRILDENLPEPAASFDVQEFSDQGIIFDEDGVVVTAFPVNHGELIKPAVGYRIDYAGVSVVISGDTTYDERLAEIARGTDLLIHEVLAFGDDVLQQVPTAEQIAAHHTTPEEAGQIFRLASPKLAAYTHLVTRGVTIEEIITRTRTQYDGPLISGEDMMSFSITRDGVQVNPQ